MLIQRKPERILDRLIRRLRKTKSLIVAGLKEEKDDMISQLEHLERKIQSMHAFFTRDRSCGDPNVEKFIQLDESIDFVLKDLEKLNKSEFHEKLRPFAENISKMKKLISSKGLRRILSKEWEDLIRLNHGTLMKPSGMEIFQASYHSLGNFKLKLCLLCFSVFPENCVIRKKPMIYWWMAEGLVTSDIDGDNTYRNLIKKGLIIPSNRKEKSCTLRPWIRRMLISIAKESEFFHFGDNGDDKCTSLPQRSLLLGENENHTNINGEDLSTVFNVNESHLSYDDKWFSKLKKVVILQLGRWQYSPKHYIEMENEDSLNGLKTQKRLKYLSLRGISRITQLPLSITQLISLTILDLRACHNLESLPPDISMLKNLTHLDVSECYLLESMPKGIDKLLALSVLKGFVIGNNKTISVSHLIGLTKLTKLSIYIRANAAVDEKEFEKLKDIKSLRILTILWGKDSRQKQESNPANIAFPIKLQKLDLRCIPEGMRLEWLDPLKFPELEKLYIKGGSLTKFAISTNKNWNLKILRLRHVAGLTTTTEDLKKMLLGVRISNTT